VPTEVELSLISAVYAHMCISLIDANGEMKMRICSDGNRLLFNISNQ